MKNIFKYIILLGFLMGMNTTSICQIIKQSNPPDLNQEIEKLRETVEELKTTLNQQKQFSEQQKEELITMKEDFKEIHDDHTWYFRFFSILGIVLGSIAGVSFYQVFFGIRNRIRKEIGNTITRNKETLLRLVDFQELEERFKANIPILVVSPDADARDTFKKTFGDMGFKKMEHHTGSIPEKLDEKLVVLNLLDKDQVSKFIELSGEKTLFVAYTKGTLDRHDRLNFANSPMTLYARIMETVRFSELKK
ncbi:MAG: NARF domain-containing protein [Saprospiraceae bacterium]